MDTTGLVAQTTLTSSGRRILAAITTFALIFSTWYFFSPPTAEASHAVGHTIVCPSGNARTADNGGGSNSLTITKPTGLSNTDVMIAQITIENGTSAPITAPAGWTLELRTDNVQDIGQAIYYKVVPVASAETATSYTW